MRCSAQAAVLLLVQLVATTRQAESLAVECAADASAAVGAGVVSVDPSIVVSGWQDGQHYTTSIFTTHVTGTTAYTTERSQDRSSLASLSPVKVQLEFFVYGYNPSDQVSCTIILELTEDDVLVDDPHMFGLRGQSIDWSGVDGGWYSLIDDSPADFHINVRLTAPLPEDFPDRQLVTGLAVTSEGHTLVTEVKNPYDTTTDGCPEGITPCLANGGLRIVVDGKEKDDVLGFSREASVADGAFLISATNLPAECRQFGGDKMWAGLYDEMVRGQRVLAERQILEDWILSFHKMAAPEWCAKYITENDLADLQSTHAVFRIETSTLTLRLNAGVNHQGDGQLDWDGRVLPDLEFWQMDVGLTGLDIENPSLSGILGETARPVKDDKTGRDVMEGFEAFRGTVEDYRVSGPMGTHFALLDRKQEGHE